MSAGKFILVACALATAGIIAGPAISQQRGVGADPITDGRMPPPAEREMMFFMANGQMKKMRFTQAGHAEIVKGARALADDTAIYHSGGKFYLVENKKMADGKMMFDSLMQFQDRQAIGDR